MALRKVDESRVYRSAPFLVENEHGRSNPMFEHVARPTSCCSYFNFESLEGRLRRSGDWIRITGDWIRINLSGFHQRDDL